MMFDDECIDQKLIDECLPGYNACMILIYIYTNGQMGAWVAWLVDGWFVLDFCWIERSCCVALEGCWRSHRILGNVWLCCSSWSWGMDVFLGRHSLPCRFVDFSSRRHTRLTRSFLKWILEFLIHVVVMCEIWTNVWMIWTVSLQKGLCDDGLQSEEPARGNEEAESESKVNQGAQAQSS